MRSATSDYALPKGNHADQARRCSARRGQANAYLAVFVADQESMVTAELRRLGGEMLRAALPFPDEVSALVLNGPATRVRAEATDVTDLGLSGQAPDKRHTRIRAKIERVTGIG